MKNRYWLLLLLCLGCNRASDKAPVKIEATDSGTVALSGLDQGIIEAIDRDTAKNKWQKLFPVYHMPVGTNFRNYERPQPGTYQLSGNYVVFTPDTPFVKGQSYYARFYLFDEGTSMWDIISKKKRLGEHRFRDILFDPQYLKNK